MDVILVRHGPAEDRDTFARTGRPDGERPLTESGRDQTRAAAAGLATLLSSIPRVYTSPLVRAGETAEIIAAACGARAARRLPGLAPGGRRDRVTRSIGRTGVALLVGHEPDLGLLLGWLVLGAPDTLHAFKKAGAAAVTFADGPAPGAGSLLWVMPPKVLRALAR